MPSGDHQTFYWRGKTMDRHPRYKGDGGFKKRRQRIFHAYKNKPCMDCQGWFEPCQMDFDHRENKLFQIGHNRLIRIELLLAEINKCDVVCANCHRLRTEQRRTKALSNIN